MDVKKHTAPSQATNYGQPTAIAEKHLLTRREAAAFLNVSERTIRRYETTGMLRSIHLTRRNVRYRRCDLEAMLNRYAVGGAE